MAKAEQPQKDTIISGDADDSPLEQMAELALLHKDKKVKVLVTGKPRTGKSTALNNLFGLALKAGPGADSITTEVDDGTRECNGVCIHYIDMPGGRAVDLMGKKALLDISKTIGRGDDSFILLYCVTAQTGFTKDDIKIVKSLNKLYGASIWNRCILVLTNSDTLRSQEFPTEGNDDMEYIKCLKFFANSFGKDILGKAGIRAPPVKLIFDCLGGEASSDVQEVPVFGAGPDVRGTLDIVAVPVARTKDDGRKPNVLPGFEIGGCLNWSDYVFMEILKKSGPFAVPLIR